MLARLRSAIAGFEKRMSGRRAYKFVIRDWVGLSDLQAAADVLATMRFSRNLAPQQLPAPAGKRVLVLAPHPDDEMIGPGGTVIQAVAAGCAVRVLYLTSGGANAARREDEARAVADRIGFDTEFLRQPERAFAAGAGGADDLARRIAAFAPDIVMVTFLLDDHDDHRRASELLFRAFESGGLDRNLEVWAYQVYSAVLPNVIVEITGAHEQKAAAIRMYESQAASRDWAHYALGVNAANSRFLRGNGPARYAEAFFVVPLHEYARLCGGYFAAAADAYYDAADREA